MEYADQTQPFDPFSSSPCSAFWFVVNVASRWDGKIQRENNPTVVHKTLESARVECDRLAIAQPSGSFVVCQAVEWRRLKTSPIEVVPLVVSGS